MRLRSLGTLKDLTELRELTPEPKAVKSKYFSSIDILCYGANLCSISMKILRDEIQVKNREGTLNALQDEVMRTFNPDFIYRGYTATKAKEFYKSIGIKPRHLK